MTDSVPTGATVAWVAIEVGTSAVAATQPGCALLNKDLAAVSSYVACECLTHCPLQDGFPVAVHMQIPFWQVEPAGHYRNGFSSIATLSKMNVGFNSQCFHMHHSYWD